MYAVIKHYKGSREDLIECFDDLFSAKKFAEECFHETYIWKNGEEVKQNKKVIWKKRNRTN